MLLSDFLIFPIVYLIDRKYGIIDKYPKTRCVDRLDISMHDI